MIRNIEDLAAHLGAHEDTEKSIARRVYKDAGCSAGVSRGKVGEREVTYTVQCRLSIRGWMPLAWRPLHGKTRRVPSSRDQAGKTDQFGRLIEPMPKGLADYLLVSAPAYLDPGTTQEQWDLRWRTRIIGCEVSPEPHKEFNGAFMRELPLDDELIRKTYRMGGLLAYLTIKVKEPVLGDYFWVTGYCEGSDWGHPTYEVPFPCTPEAIDEAIAQADKDGCATWDLTHGCDDCGTEPEWSLPSRRPVNPDCLTCEGHGIVL